MTAVLVEARGALGRERAGASLPVPPALRSGIASIQGAHTPDARAVTLAYLPTCASSLVVHVTPAGAWSAIAAGPSTIAKYRQITPGPFYLQLVLRPDAARAVFGVPLHELVDRVVPVDELWGARGRALIERVAPWRADPPSAARALEAVLAPRLGGPRPPTAELAWQAAGALEQPTGIRRLADQLGASERTLRQAFHDHVGISPKHYARIARIRRVLAEAGRAPWARLAAAHGFCDQAHLNAEFRALIGASPGQYLARQFPVVARAR